MKKEIKQVSLNIMDSEGITFKKTPVTFGIPFKKGELKDGDKVRIRNSNGMEFPVQTEIMTTWTKKGEFVKWLLGDSQLTINPDQDINYYLEYGEGISPVEPDQKIKIEEKENHYIVDTGAMRMWFKHNFKAWEHPNNPDVLSRCQIRNDNGCWQEIFQGKPGPYLYMTDQYDNYYDSCTAGLSPRVFIEESGPLRTCICIKGYHTLKSGQRFCPYILRVHLFAGSTDIKFQHTFIFDQEPYDIELSSIGMKFPLRLGNKLRAGVSGSEKAHSVANWEKLLLIQGDESSYEIYRNGEIFAEGDRTNGWACLNGNEGGALAVTKDFWQEYPKGFVIDEEGIKVEIWPKSYKENLSFTTPFEEPGIVFDGTRDEEEVKRKLEENSTAPLNLASFIPEDMEDMEWIDRVIEKYAPDRPKSYSSDLSSFNGVGAAKTTEIYLRLSPEKISEKEAESFSKVIQEPLIVTAKPEYMCNTGVFGHFYPAGDSRFSQIDKNLDKIHELGGEFNYTGMMEYGNNNTGHVLTKAEIDPRGLVYSYYIDKNPKKIREYSAYNNEAIDEMMSAWGKFIRSGEKEDFVRASCYTGNVADVAYIHRHPMRPEFEGLMHYHGPHPFGGGPAVSHTLVSGLLTHYYMTGNRRLLEIAEEAANRVVKSQEPAGIISCDAPLVRNFFAPLSVLMEVYQATWEDKYGELARKSLNWLLRTLYEPGKFPSAIITSGKRGDEARVYPPCIEESNWGSSYYWYEPATRLFPSKTLEEHLIALADYYTWYLPLDSLTIKHLDESPVICFAYDITQDFSYAACAKYILENKFQKYVENANSAFGITCFNGFIPRLLKIVADAMEHDSEAFAEAQKEWRGKRKEIPKRRSRIRPDQLPEGPPITNLGQLSTDPHPEPERL